MGLHPKAESFAMELVDQIRLFFGAADGLFTAPPESTEYRIYLDSFLVHHRILFGFFKLNPRGDDCAADHFMAIAGAWREVKRSLYSRCFGDDQAGKLGPREQVQQYLGHLSYESRSEMIDWPIADIIADTYEAWDLFLENLQPTQRSWFPDPELEEITGCKNTIMEIASPEE